MRNIISKILFTLLVLTMGIGSVWGTTYSSTPLISGDFSGMSDGTPTAISGFTYNGASISSGKLTWTGNWSEGSRDVQVTFTITGTACKLVLGHATSSSSMSIKGILYKGTTSVSNFASSAWSIDKTKTADEKEFTSLTAGTYTLKLGPGGTSSRSVITSITIYDEAAANPSAAPSITAQPATAAANYEKDATATALSVTATGNGTLTYQWYKNTANNNTSGTPISGATSASYTPSTTEVGTLYYYCVVTNTESGKSGTTAKSNVSGAITVQMNPLGDGHVLTWNLGTAAQDYTAIETTSKSSTSSLITSLSDLGMTGVNINSGKKQGKSGNTPGINFNTATEDDGKYVSLSYTITDGYEFQVTAISLKVLTITSDYGNYHAVLEDENGTKIEGSLENPSNGSLTSITFSSYKTLKGDCSLKLYGWDEKTGDANAPYSYRLGGAITITGTVAEAGATPSGYTVTYAGDKDGGSFPVDADVYASGAEVTVKDKPEGLTRTILGAPATFLGWSTNENMYGGTHYKAGDKFTITANTTLYAIWGFNITYIDEDKSTEITGLEPTYYIYGEGATLPTNPTAPTGYTFGGWYNAWCVDESSTSSSPCGENAPCGFDDTHCLTTEIGTTDTWDAEYYAKWNRTVTYKANGGIGDDIVAASDKIADCVFGTPEGKLFDRWNTAAEGDGANHAVGADVTSSLVLYAIWKDDECTSNRKSIFKAVLTGDATATVTGENDKEYAGDVLLNKLGGSDGNRNANATIEGVGSGLTTYKMNGTGAYMYGVLKKGAFQEGDKIQFAVSATPGTLAIYGAKSSDLSQRVLIATMPAPNAATVFTYTLTAANAAALAGYDAIGIYRASGVTMNPYLYSLEITGCRAWTVMRTVSFDMKGHGSAIADVPVEDGAKISAPAEPVAEGYLFQGWYKETTLENAWDFANDVVNADMILYAKWVDDPCTDRQSLSKVVLSKPSDYVATVTGYNNEEYAGSAVIGGLGEAQAADVDPSHEGNETGYKLASGGNAIVFATLSKGTFQEGDKVVVTITKAQDAYKVEEVPQPILDIYYGTNKDDATFLTTISGVSATGSYTYRLTAADITTIGSKTGIGVFRPSSGRTQNPYVYSVEIQGCRSWAIFHTLTFKNADGSATIASPSLEEGVAASTVAPTAPKVDGYRFIGWGESVGGSTVNMATYTITDDATLYAVYEEIICPTSGTLYKFVVKDGLTAENLPTVTDKDMSSYVDETGDGALTYTATANNKATINNDGTITLKDATAAYLKVELECAMAAGDQIRSTISGNPMRVQVGTTYDADKDLILTKDVYNTVDITSAMEGKKVLYIARSTNGNANLADFEVYRRPVLTGVTMNDAIVRVGSTGTPTLTLLPANDALVTNQVWTIEGEGEGTIADINATTGEVTGLAAGDVTVKVVLNSNPSIYATATVHVVNDYTRQDVTGSISWSWDKNGALSGVDAQENVNVSETLLANIGTMPNNAAFQSDKLVTTCQHAYRSGTGNGCWQGTEIKFYTTVPGAVTVNYMGTGNSDAVTLSINNWTADEYAGGWTDSKTIVVPSGWVTISASVANKLRIKSITFDAALDPTKTQEAKYQYGGYERATTEGRYGTICLPNGGVMVGADLFEVAYYGATSQKIFFDQIMNGEMEAGIPYIFLPKEGVSQLGVYYTDAADATAGNRNGLYGSYTTEVLTRNDGNYVLYNNQYLYVGDESTNVKVGANRAYIKLAEITPIEPALAPGRRRVSMGVIGAPQVTTGVGELNADETPIKVMIDGQLYIIRGEKMYDATGRLVK